MIASRYRSVLRSHLMNKPVIALSYDEKVDRLMSDIELKEYCLPIAQFSVETLTNKFARFNMNRSKIKAAMEKKLQEYRTALNEQYEHFFEIMREISPKRN
jgi:polysaccharide pyruvyl transferase WcaK-like protein